MNALEKIFLWILYSSLTSAVIVFVVLLIRKIFKNQLSPRLSHALWFLVLIRLLIPFMPESNLSLFNLFSNKSIDYIAHTSFKSNFLAGEHIIENNEEQDEIDSDNFPKYVLNNNDEKSNLIQEDTLHKRSIKILSLIWIIGFLSLCIFMFISILNFRKKAIYFNQINDTEVIDIINICRKKLNINKNITAYSENTFKTPFIYGFLNPKIYIPNYILTTVNSNQLLHICLHEIVHYKRKDIFYNLISTVAILIHWFNPIVWFAMKKMRTDRELACDNYALEILGEDESIPYGMTIINLSQIISNKHSKNILSVNFYESKSQIERRITMIKRFKKGSYKISIIAVVLFIVLGTTTLTNATNLKDKNSEFSFYSPTKHFATLDRAMDFIDFKFKVPDNIPEDYKFFKINIDEKKVIDIIFEKNENSDTHSFSFLISQDDMIKKLKDQHNTIQKGSKTNIEFDTKPLRLSNINGTNVVIKQNFEWTEDELKELKNENSKNIKHVPNDEMIFKYFVWEDEGIWYAFNYHFEVTHLEEKQPIKSIDKLAKKDDLIKIVTSIKYPKDIQNTNYTAEKFVKDHLFIYNDKDLEEAAKIIGFIPKFPLTLPGGFVPTSSHTYHFLHEGDENSSTAIATVFHLKGKDNSTPEIEFRQTKNTLHYDNLVEQKNPDVKLKTIDDIKVLTYENESKQYYVWKEKRREKDIMYTIEFTGDIDNELEIVKAFIQTSVPPYLSILP